MNALSLSGHRSFFLDDFFIKYQFFVSFRSLLFHFPSKKLENKKSIKTLSLGGHYNPFFLFPHWFLIKCQFFASSMSLLFPFPCKKQQNKKFLSLGGRVFLFSALIFDHINFLQALGVCFSLFPTQEIPWLLENGF